MECVRAAVKKNFFDYRIERQRFCELAISLLIRCKNHDSTESGLKGSYMPTHSGLHRPIKR
jgi:hypothetical protein